MFSYWKGTTGSPSEEEEEATRKDEDNSAVAAVAVASERRLPLSSSPPPLRVPQNNNHNKEPPPPMSSSSSSSQQPQQQGQNNTTTSSSLLFTTTTMENTTATCLPSASFSSFSSLPEETKEDSSSSLAILLNVNEKEEESSEKSPTVRQPTTTTKETPAILLTTTSEITTMQSRSRPPLQVSNANADTKNKDTTTNNTIIPEEEEESTKTPNTTVPANYSADESGEQLADAPPSSATAATTTATTQEEEEDSSKKKKKKKEGTSNEEDASKEVSANNSVVVVFQNSQQQPKQPQGSSSVDDTTTTQRDAFLPPASSLPVAAGKNMQDRATTTVVVVKSSSSNTKATAGASSTTSTSGSTLGKKKKKKKMELPLVASKVEGPNKAFLLPHQTQKPIISKEQQQQAAMPIPAPRYYQPLQVAAAPPPPSARMSMSSSSLLPPNYYNSHGVVGPAPPPHSTTTFSRHHMGMPVGPAPIHRRPSGGVQSAASFLAMADNDNNNTMDTRSPLPPGGDGDGRAGHHSSSHNKNNNGFHHGEIILPTEKDVLCGRGRGFFEHPGNVRMLEFVKRNKLRYKKAGKAEKGLITEQVAQLIESVGGRFLKIGGKKQNDTTTNHSRPIWVRTTHEEKIRKISHCLREEKHYVKSTDPQGNVVVRRAGSLQSSSRASPDPSTEMSASTAASLDLGDTAKNKANARNPKPKTKMDGGLTKQDRSDKSREALSSGQAQSFVKQTTTNTKPKGDVVPQKTTSTNPTRGASPGTASSYPLLAPSRPMNGIPPQATSVSGQTVIDEKLGIVMGEPKPTDILFGQDPSFYHHAGNVQLRQLIEATVGYPPLNAQNKMALARRMVAEILKEGSKFLTRQSTSPARIWYQIDGSEAEMLIFRCLEEEEAKKLSLLVQDRDSSLHALRMQATGGSTPSAAGAAATAKQATALDPIAVISQQIQQQEAAEHLAHFHAQRMARATAPTPNLPHSYPPPEAAAAPLHQPVAPFQTLTPDQQRHQARLRIGHQQSKLSEERISQVRKAAAELGRPGLSSARQTDLRLELSPAGRTETNEEEAKSKEEHLESSSSASSSSSSLEDDTSDEDEDDDEDDDEESDASPIKDDSSVSSDSSSSSDLTGRSSKHSANDLGPYDVVCGRGSGTFPYAGNKRMLTMFWNVKERYNQAKKKEKAKIGRAIIKDIKHHGGRFLKREHSGMWAEVHETTALRNVCHGIRDVSDNPEMRKKSNVADHVVAYYLPSENHLPGHLQKEKKRDRSPSQSPKSRKKAKKESSNDVPVYIPGMTSRDHPEKYAAEYNEIIDGVPTEVDIICGRGRRFAIHPGNRFMQKLVRRNAEFYVGTSRTEKALVTQFILNELFKTGGRFLKKRTDGRWETLDREGTWQKISHGIRDHLNTLQLEEERKRVGAKSVGQLLRQRQNNEKDKAKEEDKAFLAKLVSGTVTRNPNALPPTSRNAHYASPPAARTSASTAVPHVPPSRPALGMSAEILMAAQRQAEAEAAAMGMAMGGRRPITPPTTHFHPVVHLNPPTHLNNLPSIPVKRNATAHTGVPPSVSVKRNGSPPHSGR